MTEIVIPPWIIPDEENIELIDDNTVRFEPQFGRGQSQRQSYGAPRFKISRKHTVRQGEEANVLASIIAARGSYNTVRTTVKRVLRGNYGLTELLTNNSFVSGTTGWSVFSTSAFLARDRIGTFQVAGLTVGGAVGIGRTAVTSAYQLYAARTSLIQGRNSASYRVRMGTSAFAADIAQTTSAVPGLITGIGTALSTSINFSTFFAVAAGNVYSDYANCNHNSVAKCAAVDNGGNLLLRSDEFDNATWTKNSGTITANAITGPDLNSTADGFTEVAASAEHSLSQAITVSAASFDVAFSVSVKIGARGFCRLVADDAVDSRGAFFNLTTGAIVSTSIDGASFTNARAFTQDAGNGWFNFSIVVKKISSATTLNLKVIGSSDGAITSYLGSAAAVAFYVHRATCALSNVPTRQILTTTAGVAASSQSGSALYIKGLTASTTGLSLPGDFVEINGELKRLTAPLDSDGLGLGYLQFEPEIVRSPVDGDPVIFFEPMGKFILSNVRTRARVSDIELTYDLEQIYE